MSIAIDLTESARDQALLDRPVIVTRPKTKRPAADDGETAIVHSQGSSATQSPNEKLTLALQRAGTFITLAACVAALAFSAWILFDLASSATDQILMLSPNQILQGMAGP
jgi:hypothetical protein